MSRRGVDAVVVNYNAGDHLLHCVASLRRAGIDRVIVVDNGSTDGSLELLAAADDAATIIETGKNLGYGGGVNRGLAAVDRAHVLVMNADAMVGGDAVGALVDVLDRDSAIGIVGPRIDEVDGSLYPSARSFPRFRDAIGHAFVGLVTTENRYSRRYLMTAEGATGRDVDWVSGACFLARREVLSAIGGFDDSYFMYLEDVDLCWRAGRAGWRVRYEPAARVTHVGGVSTSQTPYRMLAAHHSAMLRFWWRTASFSGRLLAPVVALGLGVRLAGMAARRAIFGRRSH